ncbi:hypothetical protein APR41_12535 [Salegentibacter salinarum]|uniref:Uncharacterized protein n=1 Tax=Salegentibacter salinarum TaxID=447422 RepID=A0A2N0U1J1_9FLAO|nr:hypothetical protein APR41_12535 [Salegentibacter salinarum]
MFFPLEIIGLAFMYFNLISLENEAIKKGKLFKLEKNLRSPCFHQVDKIENKKSISSRDHREEK